MSEQSDTDMSETRDVRLPAPEGRLIDRGSWQRRTYVKSPPVSTGQITAWHVREFVKALDAAGIPDSATVAARRANDTSAFIELSTYKQENRDED